MTAREEMLARVRRALADRPQVLPPERAYHRAGDLLLDDPPAVFAERVAEYRATVLRCASDLVASTLTDLLARCDAPVVIPEGFPTQWRPDGAIVTVGDDPIRSAQELDSMAAVVTTATCGIALTGTIVLDHGPGQGRRALTLVPDRHVVVIRAEQIVAGVPDAIAVLDPSRPLTWISGPSATSDIELDRVEGVHGPRQLTVLIVG